MPPTRHRVQDLEAATRFQATWLEKALRLIEALPAIQNDSHLKGKLALKSGTALNLGYLGLARLSVDLDFNYIGTPERERMMTERPPLEQRVEQIAARLGYYSRRLGQGYATTTFILSYTTVFGGPDALRIEINYLNRIPLFGVKEIVSCQIGEEPTITFLSISPEELMGGKVKALVERSAARDLFDVHRYMAAPIDGLNAPNLRTSFLVLAATISADVRTLTPEAVLAAVDDDKIQTELLPALRRTETVDRNILAKSTMPLLRDFFAWSDAERAFLDAVASGKIEPEHLTEDGELRMRIQRHPALNWKSENVAAHLKGDKPPKGRRRGRPRRN